MQRGTLSTSLVSVDIKRSRRSFVPSEISDHLLGLLGVDGQVVSDTPLCQSLHLASAGRLIPTGDETDQGCHLHKGIPEK